MVYKTYTADGETYTTNLVSAVEDAYFNDDSVMYRYDDAGRIIMQGTSTTSETYNYDGLNRLSGMTISGMSYSYAYDSKNNLLTETTTNRYNTILDTTNYTYNAYGQLTSVANSGRTDYFRYDELGNMTMYKGGTASGTDNLSWCEGNKLASGAFNENEFSYEYDPKGHRYKKIVNDEVTEYYLDGSRVIAENRIDDNVFIYYYYDQSGIIGMNYNGSDYYFGKNILGDITEIYNSSGTVVGSYEYDP